MKLSAGSKFLWIMSCPTICACFQDSIVTWDTLCILDPPEEVSWRRLCSGLYLLSENANEVVRKAWCYGALFRYLRCLGLHNRLVEVVNDTQQRRVCEKERRSKSEARALAPAFSSCTRSSHGTLHWYSHLVISSIGSLELAKTMSILNHKPAGKWTNGRYR